MLNTNNLSKVSIIMATYNRAKYIIETVESILQQTYLNWELIIVDDGSDDNTEEIITQINDKRIRFFKAGRTGIGGKIKNMGLKKANGELIAFIDSDDLWDSTKMEKQVASLQQYPEAGFSLTGGYNFQKPGVPVDFFYKQPEGVSCNNVFVSFFKSELPMFTQALMLRKQCLEVTGLFQETRSFVDGDLDFILRLAQHYKAVTLYEPLVYRRLHDTNYTGLNWVKSHQEGLEIIRLYKNSKFLPVGLVRTLLFRSYIHFGEICLRYKERGKAITSFLKAWRNKPFSIIPLKKTGKAILYFIKAK